MNFLKILEIIFLKTQVSCIVTCHLISDRDRNVIWYHNQTWILRDTLSAKIKIYPENYSSAIKQKKSKRGNFCMLSLNVLQIKDFITLQILFTIFFNCKIFKYFFNFYFILLFKKTNQSYCILILNNGSSYT